jgi:N-acetylmuramic acid 6-phosphate etherase
MTHEGTRAAASLPLTEQINSRTAALDTLDAAGIVRLMNDEDKTVAHAVEAALPEVARVVEAVVARMHAGGRLFYIGAGTSGRLGVLDASECPPTFGVKADRVQGIIAGGYDALYKATETSEDSAAAGANDLQARGVNARDAVVGIACIGRHAVHDWRAFVGARGRRVDGVCDVRSRFRHHARG